MMKLPKAHIAAATALVCVVLCAAPLLARPTSPVARTPVHRLVVPASRELPRAASRRPAANPAASHKSAAHASSTQPVASHRPVKSAGKQTGVLVADPYTISRVHAWEKAQRNAPIHSPIAVRVAKSTLRLNTASPELSSSPKLTQPDPTSSIADVSAAPHQAALNDDPGDLMVSTTELPPIKTIGEEAVTPVFIAPARVLLSYDKRGRLLIPPPLYGSHEVLLHQNQMADQDGLTRVQDDEGLLDLRREKKLVALPEDETLRIDTRLPANRRFSRPWTAQFLAILSRDHYAAFHLPLQVDSAVRTVEVQQHLVRTNGNAAPAAGDTASPHLTGQAIDIAKSGLSLTEIAWMRTYLQPLIDQGKIDVEEEFQQACFHISVYKNYLPSAPARNTLATRQSQTAPAY